MKQIVIAGESFDVPDAEALGYTEGHVCTAAEARSLFQTRCENIGNNMRKTVQAAIESGKLDEARNTVAQYANEYTFAMPGAGGGGRKMDPVEREARNLARASLKDHLAKQGRKLKDVPEDKLEAAIDKVIEQNDLMAKAKKIVAARQKAGAETLDDIDLAA